MQHNLLHVFTWFVRHKHWQPLNVAPASWNAGPMENLQKCHPQVPGNGLGIAWDGVSCIIAYYRHFEHADQSLKMSATNSYDRSQLSFGFIWLNANFSPRHCIFATQKDECKENRSIWWNSNVGLSPAPLPRQQGQHHSSRGEGEEAKNGLRWHLELGPLTQQSWRSCTKNDDTVVDWTQTSVKI